MLVRYVTEVRNKEKATTDTTALNNVLYTNSLRERYDDMSCYVSIVASTKVAIKPIDRVIN